MNLAYQILELLGVISSINYIDFKIRKASLPMHTIFRYDSPLINVGP
jgi:hypothetical protein